MNDKQQPQQPAITLEPPWWRCENGSEFRSGNNKPTRCPVCGSTNIEMIVEINAALSLKKGRARR